MNNTPWPDSLPERLRQQLTFLMTVNELKTVHRASVIQTGGRKENSAEHSWHVSLFAHILAEYAELSINVHRAIIMLLIHDIVEIDAGDLPLHAAPDPSQSAREQAAADRLFSLLPADQAATVRQLWDEFETSDSADARFAKAIDRLQPVLLNFITQGGTWPDFEVSLSQVKEKTIPMKKGSETLWQCANAIYEDATRFGWLRQDETPP